MLQRLPLDINTFRELRESKYLYVDKTKYAYNLITGGRRFFLSRPRRFGKSLLVSMMKEVLSGNKGLFDELWIANSDYSWQQYGVIKLDFSTLDIHSIDKLERSLCSALLEIAQDYNLGISVDREMPSQALRSVTRALHKKFGRVAVLVDEYDNPIVRSLKDREYAEEVLDTIKSFFATIKGMDEYINFAFITGVSAFAGAGLFSGINNLQIITLNNKFSDICGYTDEEMDLYFKDYIQAWAKKENLSYDELRSQIKDWYNGYEFGENVPAVYNPFSLMHALAAQAFKNFWIKSGTPTFLIEQLKKYYSQYGNIVLEFEGLEVSEDILQSFDVDAMPLPALMFQAGYITLSGYDKISNLYSLEYPNREVATAVKGYLLEVFTNFSPSIIHQIYSQLYVALNNGDIGSVIALLKQLFSRVTYYEQKTLEHYYHTALLNIFTLGGIEAQSQYTTNIGRADITLTLPKIFYIIEIKLNEQPELALRQVQDRRYYEPFLNKSKPIILLGLSFMRKKKSFDIKYAFEKI